jgi:4'-phosphopantetheinyl transferase
MAPAAPCFASCLGRPRIPPVRDLIAGLAERSYDGGWSPGPAGGNRFRRAGIGKRSLDSAAHSEERHPGEPIRRGEVHVWTASLQTGPEGLLRYSTLLSEQETARASRYVFARDREHFIVCRGILRELLGSYLFVPGKSLEISGAGFQKPALAQTFHHQDLRFNLSHSHGFAILAFSLGLEVGVDVERIRHDIEDEEVARRYFSNAERAELAKLGGTDRKRAFFLCWTRKEAYLKARGDGLKVPLDSFSVTLRPDRLVRLSSQDSDHWSLHSLEVAAGFAAALAVEGTPTRISVRAYSPDSTNPLGTLAEHP